MKRLTSFAFCTLVSLSTAVEKASSEVAFPQPADVIPGRPRLLMRDADLERLRADYQAGGQTTTRWIDALVQNGEALLTSPLINYPPADRDMLEESRHVMRRAYTLAFLHRWTGDRRFGERLWRELEAAARQETWRPHLQFLTTAEMLHGFAVAHDWLYDFWTPAQRAILEEAIATKGLDAGRAAYAGELPGYAGWNSSHNWNAVCNSSLILGALTLMPNEPERCETILRGAFKRLPKVIAQYGVDGGWAEGPTYWAYTTSYLGTLLAALDTAFGQDYGLAALNPGLSQTGHFPLYMASPTGGSFNFGDSEKGLPRSHALFELGRRFGRPEWIEFQKRHGQGSAADLAAWSRAMNKFNTQPQREHLPLDRHFSGVGVLSFRSAWDDSGATWVALKAGKNGANHGHLDLGSFVFEALGHRWFHDLEKESYSSPGFFEMGEGGRRWSYYALRAEGHNTLVIDPSERADQFVRAQAKVIQYHSTASEALAVVDLTDAYIPRARKVWRGIRLTDSRSRLYLQDEIELAKPAEVVWSVHVIDAVELSPDRRRAVLSAGSKQLSLILAHPLEARFEILPAEPLVKIQNVPQRANPAYRKIAIRLQVQNSIQIGVWFEPSPTGSKVPFSHATGFGELSGWSPDNRAAATLSSITIDDKTVADFQPHVFSYEINSAGPGAIRYAPEDVVVSVLAAATGEGVTTHYLRTDAPDMQPALYQVRVRRMLPPPVTLSAFPDRSHWKVRGPSDGTHVPNHVLDGSLHTRWSAYSEQAVLDIDLGAQPVELHAIAIAFYKGDARRSSFSLEISDNGNDYREILPPTWSSGITTQAEQFTLAEPVRARHLRLRGRGNSENAWTSITEVVVLDSLPPAQEQ